MSFRFTFALADFGEYLDIGRLQFYQASLSGSVLAIASDRYLVLTDGSSDSDDSVYSSDNADSVRLVLEFNEESGYCTCLSWITEDIVGVGFEHGLFVCFNCAGEEVFEYRGHTSPVQAIKLGQSVDRTRKGVAVWILYEAAWLISVRFVSTSLYRTITLSACSVPQSRCVLLICTEQVEIT